MSIDRKSFVIEEMRHFPVQGKAGQEETLSLNLTGIAFKGIGFQEMEQNLREQESNIYLVAKKVEARRHFSLINPSGEAAEYSFTVVIGNQEKAFEEILKHSSSQEDNFLKLVKTGVMGIRL